MRAPDPAAIPAERLGWHLRRARAERSLSRRQAAARADISAADLRRWERGQAAPAPEELDHLAVAYGMSLVELVPPRRPIAVDVEERVISAGPHRVPLPEARDDEVLDAYLQLVHRLRGIRPGRPVPLRDDDLVVLADVLGDDPSEIEERLVTLMGLTREQADAVRTALLRRRILPAAAGLVAGTSFMVFGATAEQSAEPPAIPAVEVVEAPVAALEPVVVAPPAPTAPPAPADGWAERPAPAAPVVEPASADDLPVVVAPAPAPPSGAASGPSAAAPQPAPSEREVVQPGPVDVGEDDEPSQPAEREVVQPGPIDVGPDEEPGQSDEAPAQERSDGGASDEHSGFQRGWAPPSDG